MNGQFNTEIKQQRKYAEEFRTGAGKIIPIVADDITHTPAGDTEDTDAEEEDIIGDGTRTGTGHGATDGTVERAIDMVGLIAIDIIGVLATKTNAVVKPDGRL